MDASQNVAAQRWLAVGQSDDADARQAGRTATARALAGPDPKLLIVFCCEAYDLAELIEGIRETAGGRLREAGADVAGCIDRVADKAHRVLLLLTDGLAGDQAEIVRGAVQGFLLARAGPADGLPAHAPPALLTPVG